MGMMGIMNRVRGMRIVENGFHVRLMFLLLGLLLSIVNLPTASGQSDFSPTPGNSEQNPLPRPPLVSFGPSGDFVPSVVVPPPPVFVRPLTPTPGLSPPSPGSSPPLRGSSPSSPGSSPSSPGSSPSSPGSSPSSPGSSPPSVESPLPPSPLSTTQSIGETSGDNWNESEIAGVVIASIAALLQVAVVAFLLIKRHQMLTTVEYDDIEDLEYDTPPDSNFRDIESA